MIILDTDTLTHYLMNHPRVVQRHRDARDEVLITVISRIETLQGRFATLLKAADGAELQRGQERLKQAEIGLAPFGVVLIDAEVAAEFDRLRQVQKLKKIGRADLLIVAITLANGATLVTRNVKDFRQVPGLQLENWMD
jgi:tRNA(fMet)-specific endonuclease VapC